jgi:hypothetical protein
LGRRCSRRDDDGDDDDGARDATHTHKKGTRLLSRTVVVVAFVGAWTHGRDVPIIRSVG